MRKCAIEGCDRKHSARGYCQKHYEYWKKHGVPIPPSALDRFWMKVDEPDEQGCKCWTAYVNTNGTGRFNPHGKPLSAHRWIYEQIVGPIPEGMVLDHECHNRDLACAGGDTCKHRRCMTIEHMTPKTIAENVRAGVWGRHIKYPCSINGCEVLAKSRGFCNTHYEQWRKMRLEQEFREWVFQ